ncbi:MAG: Type I transmembrane sorting receptor [Geoglossum umbratile]|nr:MAG: Type I transmembrane sorting receptor [Geoglossum umbratile]
MGVVAYLILAAAALSFVAQASPIALEKRGQFSVKQQANAAFTRRNGALALAKAYGKYGATAEVVVATAGGDTGRVVANPTQFDAEYICPVSIGGQTVNLVFDTGSADLAVRSRAQHVEGHCNEHVAGLLAALFPTPVRNATTRVGHNAYNFAKSRTYKELQGQHWEIHYGDGSSASGIVGTDTVNIGGVTVNEQAFGLATVVSDQFQRDVNSDGLLGLSFSSINTIRPNPQKTFFDSAKLNLSLPVFTVDLKHQAPGTYDFGFVDPTKFKGPMAFVPVDNKRGFWGFTTSGFGVGSKFVEAPDTGIADTGTTLLILNDTIVNAYYSAVPGASFDAVEGGITFPCYTALPDLTILIGTHKAVIPGELMNFAPVVNERCFGSIQSSARIGFSIYGDILFKSQFAVFDDRNLRMGFADKP